MLLETAVFNIESALAAAKAGTDRIELCENGAEGGTTPSYGMLKTAREKISLPLFIMVRARGGNFVYTSTEFESMCKDVLLIKSIGLEGIVTGALHADGSVDKEKTKKLVALSYPMEVTFHRAFDKTTKPFKALEDIIECGCQRILTSGLQPNAEGDTALLRQLIIQAAEKIIIMPGGGISSSNIQFIAKATGAEEFHSSAIKKIHASSVIQTTAGYKEDETFFINEEEIKKMKNILNNLAITE
jgi:copper homeostasis protein